VTDTPLDLLPLADQLARMNARDAAIPAVVAAAAPQVHAVVERTVTAVHAGGRVVYLGAGTPGRLGVLDAVELGPTFDVADGSFVAVAAGRVDPLRGADDSQEDDAEAAVEHLDAVGLGAGDVLVAVSASGTTPYTLAGVRLARQRGAASVAIVCVPGSAMALEADLPVLLPVGREVLQGSTRLGAGTAQKLVLNQISTLTMVQLGRVYGDLMAYVRTDNIKLRARARGIVETASGRPGHAVAAALTAADGDARVALVSLRLGVGAQEARELLAAAGGDLRTAMGERE